MADDLSAAEQWAQANPNHPKAQAVLAKAWAMRNPSDPRSGQIMAKLGQAVQQSQNPQQIPDSADKAAQGMKANAQPLSLMDPHYQSNMMAKLGGISPQGLEQTRKMEDQVGTPQGVQQLATTLIPGSAGLMAKGAGLASRLGIGALAGGTGAVGVQDPNNDAISKMKSFGLGAGIGLGGQAISEGVGAGVGALKNMYQTAKMAQNPAGAQDTAVSAISQATDKLRKSESENLAEQLGGKSLGIDTTRIRGIHPEIDEILSKYKSPYGDLPSVAQVDAQDANKIKSLLDQQMSYRVLGPNAQVSEVTAARDAGIKTEADKLRGQIHDLSPQISDTLDQWSDNLNMAKNVDRRSQTAPMTVLTSPSFDRRALLQKVDDQAGTDLQGLGTQINNAKDLSNSMHNGVHPMDALFALGRSGLQGAGQALSSGQNSDPGIARALDQGLLGKKTQGQ